MEEQSDSNIEKNKVSFSVSVSLNWTQLISLIIVVILLYHGCQCYKECSPLKSQMAKEIEK